MASMSRTRASSRRSGDPGGVQNAGVVIGVVPPFSVPSSIVDRDLLGPPKIFFHRAISNSSGSTWSSSAAAASPPPAKNNNPAASSSSPTAVTAREHLFDKTVTPSDVGKLNRLVIPKQHAEKHFPLQLPAAAAAVVGGECKGVLLNFEDATGKVWRFRYSYWNSSQSYVLTKGWSRFVKEKGLHAGDAVGFYRSAGGKQQFFIDCKLRPKTTTTAASFVNATTTTAAPSPVKAVRLFGVDLLTTPRPGPAVVAAPEQEEIAMANKRARDAIAACTPVHMVFKKQCIYFALT